MPLPAVAISLYASAYEQAETERVAVEIGCGAGTFRYSPTGGSCLGYWPIFLTDWSLAVQVR